MKRNIFIMLTLLFVMVGTFVFGATFSDVKGTKYQDSVDLLTTLKIVNGKTTTSFAPNDEVKRSEMAKMLVVALGRDADASKATGKTKFPDVVDKHWATGYINIATELGIIKGYPDGTFAPDDTVSYVEALTMMLRALNYEDVNKLSWPNGYIDRAKEIKLVNNVVVNNYDNGAIRGDIAIMVNNTLMANTREIVASNDTGVVYGNGKVLLSKSFSGYEYYDNAIVSDIDDSNSTITVTDSSNKKHNLTYSNSDIYKLYGKDVRILYDTKNEKFLALDIASDNATVSGSVTKVESKNIYVKKVAYALPKSSYIKLIGISDIDDAEEAYVTTKNGTVTHVVAIGEEDLFVGLVTTKSTKSSNKYKVTLVNTDGDKNTFVQADQSLTIKKDEVIIYALNEDEEIVVRYRKTVDDGLEIESVSKTELKLKGKTKYTFSTTDKPIIIEVDDGEITERSTLTSMDKKYDTALVIEAKGATFVIYFVDGLDEAEVEDENASATKTIAKKRLNTALSNAEKALNKETSYSIATIEKVREKYESADKINQSTASIATMDKASLALETAIDNLSKVTTADKTLRADFAKLTSKIKEAKTLAKNTEYTEATRTALSKVITTSEKITITTTTSAKIETAIKNLDEAIGNLVSSATEERIAALKAEIEDLIKKAENKDSTKYTAESYSKLKDKLSVAKEIKGNYTKYTTSELIKISNELETAISNLISKDSVLFENAKKSFKELQVEVKKQYVEEEYTQNSWTDVKKFLDIDIDEKYKNVTEDEMADKAIEIGEDEEKFKEAINNLSKTPELKRKERLAEAIDEAEKIMSDDCTDETLTYESLKTLIADAQKLKENSSATVDQLDDMIDKLNKYIDAYR